MEDAQDDVAFISESTETISLRKKSKETHVSDAWAFILDDGNHIEEDVRAFLLREHVQSLKDDLQTSHDQAWNHPDEIF